MSRNRAITIRLFLCPKHKHISIDGAIDMIEIASMRRHVHDYCGIDNCRTQEGLTGFGILLQGQEVNK